MRAHLQTQIPLEISLAERMFIMPDMIMSIQLKMVVFVLKIRRQMLFPIPALLEQIRILLSNCSVPNHQEHP
jgi:hypothetical protein